MCLLNVYKSQFGDSHPRMSCDLCVFMKALTHVHGGFMLMYGRNQHRTVKQLSFNLK